MTTAKKQVQTAAEPVDETVRIKACGVEACVGRSVFDDLELLDMLDDMQSGNALKVKKIMDRIFRDDAKKVYDGLRNERGDVTVSRAAEFLAATIEQANAGNA